MSGSSARRLKRLETAAEPKPFGYYHCVYAHSEADFERQKADLIASGRAKATDLILDANWRSWKERGWSEDAPEYGSDVREPETHAWTKTWMEYINERDAAKQQEGAAA